MFNLIYKQESLSLMSLTDQVDLPPKNHVADGRPPPPQSTLQNHSPTTAYLLPPPSNTITETLLLYASLPSHPLDPTYIFLSKNIASRMNEAHMIISQRADIPQILTNTLGYSETCTWSYPEAALYIFHRYSNSFLFPTSSSKIHLSETFFQI